MSDERVAREQQHAGVPLLSDNSHNVAPKTQSTNNGDAVEQRMCAATTRKGKPCGNQALSGSAYCRVHMALTAKPQSATDKSAAANVAQPEQPRPEDVDDDDGEIAIRDVRASANSQPTDGGALPYAAIGQAADSVYEIEIEVREHADGQDDLAAGIGAVAASLLRMIGENLQRMTPQQVRQALDMLRGINPRDFLDPNFWEGIWMVVSYQFQEQYEFVQRRLRGDYPIDPYGLDYELVDRMRPFMSFMYRTWWRITTEGIENVPEAGRSLIVANYGGILSWESAMIGTAIAEEHPSPRLVRNLFLPWFNALPFIAPAMAALGNVPGLPENALRLLEEDELVCVFPESMNGIGKLFRNRYRLGRFGHGGFVQTALRTGAPLTPVAITGSAETFPILSNAETIAKMLGLPYFPVTPFFPWLGPLGLIPLPSRWTITFGEPIPTAQYGPESADDSLIVFMLSEQARCAIQTTLDAKLKERTSVF